VNLLFGAIGPQDFQVVDLGVGAKAEVQPRVGVGSVATAGKDVRPLADTARSKEDLGAGGVAGRFEAGHRQRRLCNQFDPEPVVGGLSHIAEKSGGRVDVV